MSTSTQEFKNKQITVNVHQEPHCIVKLDITVHPEATQAAHAKAVREISKEVSIPGFRKGKVPETMLSKQFGKDIEKEFKNLVINTSFKEALDLTKLYPYKEKGSIRRLDCPRCSKDEGATINVEYEAFPSVPEVEPKSLHFAKKNPNAVTPKDIEDEILQMTYHYATWQEVTDRPAQEGDFVDLKIVALENENEREICDNTRFLIAQGKMGEWMRKLIIGLNAGESAVGWSEKEDPESEAPFKSTECRLTVQKIYTAVLPALDEELAKKFGAASLEDFQTKVVKSLEKKAVDLTKEKMREELQTLLSDKYHFELPTSLVEEEKRERLHQLLHRLDHQKNLSKEEKQERKKELDIEAQREAERALRLQYLLYKVIHDHHLDVAPAEVLQEYVRQLMLPEDERLISTKEEDVEVSRSYLRRVILFQKALDHLIAQT